MTGVTPLQSVGIAGTGRLGTALAARLKDRFAVLLYDTDRSCARRAATTTALPLADAETLVTADVVLLCVPPQETDNALLGLARCAVRGGRRPLFVSLATSVPTARLRSVLAQSPDLAGIDVVGLKPVCQFAALARGVPTVMVTEDTGRLDELRYLASGLGTVLVGDENVVGPVNRAATKAALRACAQLTDELSARGVDLLLVRAAVGNVLAGTALDHPPAPDNSYTRSVLAELAAEQVPPPVPQSVAATAAETKGTRA
ncbi:NAD(P)-binding domain-containing protein [Streptomyces sp. NPDC004680]|uniref:NAD(P)-binding domain-containing protein n=1 Tax=Streptomyces sp. NPDC004680 TaxID=3154287 RepID=UPI00339E2E13